MRSLDVMRIPRAVARRWKRRGAPVRPPVTVVVHGLGRCGTSMLYASFVRAGLAKRPFIDDLTQMESFEAGTALKTHCRPPQGALPSHVRIVYLFTNPMDIAISAHRLINQWSKMHHEHLGSKLHRDNDQVFAEDSLCLAEHFDLWYRPHAYPVLALRYEALWSAESTRALSEYVGFEVELPAFRERKADWSKHPRKEELSRVYGVLAERIASVPDVQKFSG